MLVFFLLAVAFCGVVSAQVFSPVATYAFQQPTVDQPVLTSALIPYSTANAVKHTPQVPYASTKTVVTTNVATVAAPYTLTASLTPYATTTTFPPASSSLFPPVSLPASSSILPASTPILPASSSITFPASSSILPASAPLMPYNPYLPTTTTTTDTITASTVVPLASGPVVQLYTPARTPNNVVVDSRGNAHNVFRYGPRQPASSGNVLKPVDPGTAATLSNQGKPVLASQPDVPIPSSVITSQGLPLVASYGPARTTTTTTTATIPYTPAVQIPYVPRTSASAPLLSVLSAYGPPAPAASPATLSSTPFFATAAFVYGPAAPAPQTTPYVSGSSQSLLPSAMAVYTPSTATTAPPLPYVPTVQAGGTVYRPPRDVAQGSISAGNAALYVPASSTRTAPRPVYVSQPTPVPVYAPPQLPSYVSPTPAYVAPTPVLAPVYVPRPTPAYSENNYAPAPRATASPTTYVMPFGWGFKATNLTRPTPAPTAAPTRAGKSLGDKQRDALRQRPLNATQIALGLKQPAVVSFDFDGTLQNVTVGRSVGTPYPQVMDFLKELGAAGAQIIITTARTPEDNALIEDFLNKNNATQYVTQIYNTETSDKTAALQAAGAQVHVDDRSNVLAQLKKTDPSIRLLKVADGSVADYH